jgi:transcription antitermination factor NusA-like protein
LIASAKIGHLVPGIVVKALPHYEASLVLIAGTELLAVLPQAYAAKPMRVGDNIVAVIFSAEPGRITLSQKHHQYYKRLIEGALTPFLMEGKIRVRRVAVVSSSNFAKASIEMLNGEADIRAFVPHIKELKAYTDTTITLVKYSRDIEEYIKNSLVPAPSDKVTKVIYLPHMERAYVKVEQKYLGLFIGPKGANVASAAKLLNMQITVNADS